MLLAINNLDEQLLRMDACAKLGLNKQNKHNGAGFYNNLTVVNSHVHLGSKRKEGVLYTLFLQHKPCYLPSY